ncbi:UDP:flavonoid glycosyltransferase YjiC (YdhE family) [Kutzneria viridogrisea]|uniref:UDP:flavonoid glycosyltransferase YjiC (YdhE family) n=1 Tax=Kutzneria viridogrisea TaxID=47990 RepID=A0ABR6BAE3_9PSEU|nr:UDP:flavonoid glycosyltransferase YjiC (YdhE family) [Kutzneria viridogrisea]
MLFTTSAWPTHYFSLVPIGWALQAAGHDVRITCAESQTDTIARAGLTPVPIMDGLEMTFASRLARYQRALAAGGPYQPGSILHPLTCEPLRRLANFDLAGYRAAHREANLDRMRVSCDNVVAHARAWRPDLILHDPQNVEGVLAAALTGVPAVCNLWGFVGTHETEPGLGIVTGDHSDSFPRYGLPEMTADMITRVIDPCPAGAPPMTTAERFPVRYVPYNGVGHAPDWVRAKPADGRPRVLVSWSTALSRVYGQHSYLLPTILDALSKVDAEVVLAATPADLERLGDELPSGVRVLVGCPLRLILPSCAAVVHHGGAGTTMTAVLAGVPQLALTFEAEQAMQGRRAVAGGGGFQQDGTEATAELIRDQVTALLTAPRYAEAAERLRAEALDRPTPAQLVDDLEKLVG